MTHDRLFPNRESMRAFLKANDKELCEDCGCCERVTDECEQCGGVGVYGHDCGEDCCCCLDPEDNETCDICGGTGSFKHCIGNCEADGHRDEEASHDASDDAS
jgi:hypothetical protein